MRKVDVIKRNIEGQETWRYPGTVIQQDDECLLLEAFFNLPDTPFHGITLKKGDRFVETFFSRRWYNIFEVYDRDDGKLKGWYCNVSFPAEFQPDAVSWVDLALDLLVYPDGKQIILDEDEFASLTLSEDVKNMARAALAELQERFAKLPEQG